MEALAVPPSEHEAAGELVNNNDLPILDDVVGILLHHAVGLDCLVDVVVDGGVTVGLIIHDMDKPARQKAYAADITYGTPPPWRCPWR